MMYGGRPLSKKIVKTQRLHFVESRVEKNKKIYVYGSLNKEQTDSSTVVRKSIFLKQRSQIDLMDLLLQKVRR